MEERRISDRRSEEHSAHHEFMRKWIKEIEDRQARNERIRTSVLGWIIITILGGIGTGIYRGALLVAKHLNWTT